MYTATEAKAVWQIRESGPRAAGLCSGARPAEMGKVWDDCRGFRRKKLGGLSARYIRSLMNEYGYRGAFLTDISGTAAFTCASLLTWKSESGIRKYGEFIERAADLVVFVWRIALRRAR